MKLILIISTFLLVVSSQSLPQLDRSVKPEPGPAPIIELDEYSTFTLENGLKIIVVENHKIPKVTFSLLLDIDPILENDTAGYVSATGQLLRTGTKTRSKDQLDREIDFIGAGISTSATGASASALKKHINKIVELFSDVLINPEFKSSELEKIKLRMQSDIAYAKNDPSSIAGIVSNKVKFGENHPYGEHATEETVKKITLEKCLQYYNAHFKPNAAFLAVVGDITEEEIKPLLVKYFGAWEKGDVPQLSYPVPEVPEKSKVILVDRPNSVQSVVQVTYPVELKIGDQDDVAATVMNTILGGGEFRLYKNLRETHAFTYGAYSSLRKDEVIGSFTAYADVRNQITDSAVAEILSEMKRIKSDKVPPEELEIVKNYISGNFAISLEQPQTIARFALNIERLNLPEDYYATYLKKIASVTSVDVQNAAQKFIKPDQAYIIVVGNKDQTAEKLSSFGEISYYNSEGEPADLEMPEGVTGAGILQNYIDAIGGEENLKKVEDRTTVLEGAVQGVTIKMTSYQKNPNLFRQEINAGGMEQVILYDGTKGYFFVQENVKEVTGSELEKLATESRLNLLLDLEEEGIKLEFAGVDKFNNRDVYKVEMKFPSGTKWIQFYDKETGLKLKENKPVISAQGTYDQETIFEDYREVNGVKYPFLLKQSLGSQNIELKVLSIEVNKVLKDEMFKLD